MADYSFVIDNTFQPFTMQEMLVPFTAYSDAYAKTEEAYNELTDKANAFKYLSKTLPKGSKARDIYEGYANDLKVQAEDLGSYGLTRGNRIALGSLRRRFSGEIGRLVKADEALKEEKTLRKQLNAQDSSRLYAIDNLSVDDFLDGSNPNLYSVSGKELYTRGANIGKAYSSRVFTAGDKGSTLAGLYRDYVTTMGYNPETINAFRKDMSKIPELRDAADALLLETGASNNLKGNNLERARQSVINGIIDNAIYTETHNPIRDVSVPSWSEKVQADQGQQSINVQKDKLAFEKLQYADTLAMSGMSRGKDGKLVYNSENDIKSSQSDKKKSGKSSGGSEGSKSTHTVLAAPILIGARTGSAYKVNDGDTFRGDPQGVEIKMKVAPRALTTGEYSALKDKSGTIVNPALRNTIEGGDLSDYDIKIIPKSDNLGTYNKLASTGFFNDDNLNEDVYLLTPKKSNTDYGANQGNNDGWTLGDAGTQDVGK